MFRTFIETNETNRSVSKQTETNRNNLNFQKKSQIYSLLNCFGLRGNGEHNEKKYVLLDLGLNNYIGIQPITDICYVCVCVTVPVGKVTLVIEKFKVY